MKQWEKVLCAIRDAGSLGITTAALISEIAPNHREGFKGCAKYTGRISDARKHGWDIRCFSIPQSSQSRYFCFGRIGEEPRFTEEYCIATTKRLALKRVRKLTWTHGPKFSLGEWVTV